MMNRSLPVQPVVAYLTDFGLNETVGVMKGVVLGIAPEARIVDLTHAIAPQDIASGAWALGATYRYFPAETIFVCIVDPGVGSARRAIALHLGNWRFVGPDNGIFSYVLAEQSLHAAVALSNPAYHLPVISSTFHGRDIFSPAAAHLAQGVSITALGNPIEPDSLQRLDYVRPERHNDHIEARVAYIDHFGNIITTIPIEIVPDLYNRPGARLTFTDIHVQVTARRRFFADESGEAGNEAGPFIYVDSSGHIGVAIRNGNAANTLGIHKESTITFDLME